MSREARNTISAATHQTRPSICVCQGVAYPNYRSFVPSDEGRTVRHEPDSARTDPMSHGSALTEILKRFAQLPRTCKTHELEEPSGNPVSSGKGRIVLSSFHFVRLRNQMSFGALEDFERAPLAFLCSL